MQLVCHLRLVLVIGHFTHVTPPNPQSINSLMLRMELTIG